MEIITITTSGISVGNPGPSVIEAKMVDGNGTVLQEIEAEIGNATSHFASYEAVMCGLQVAIEHFGEKTKEFHFNVTLDNEFVQGQLNGVKEIKEPGLVPYFIEIHNMQVTAFPHLTFLYRK